MIMWLLLSIFKSISIKVQVTGERESQSTEDRKNTIDIKFQEICLLSFRNEAQSTNFVALPRLSDSSGVTIAWGRIGNSHLINIVTPPQPMTRTTQGQRRATKRLTGCDNYICTI